MKNPELLNIVEAAEYLDVTVATMYSYNHKHVISYYRPIGKKVYYRRTDLDLFLFSDKNRIKSEAEINALAEAKMHEARHH